MSANTKSNKPSPLLDSHRVQHMHNWMLNPILVATHATRTSLFCSQGATHAQLNGEAHTSSRGCKGMPKDVSQPAKVGIYSPHTKTSRWEQKSPKIGICGSTAVQTRYYRFLLFMGRTGASTAKKLAVKYFSAVVPQYKCGTTVRAVVPLFSGGSTAAQFQHRRHSVKRS